MEAKTTWKKKPRIKNAFLRYGLWVLVVAYLLIAGSEINVDPARIAKGMSRMGKLFSGFSILISVRGESTSSSVSLRALR